MHDTHGPDAKLLCVPATDPRQLHLQELEDVPMHQIAEIWHFFEIYEALAPDKSAETRNWERREKAVEALEERVRARGIEVVDLPYRTEAFRGIRA